MLSTEVVAIICQSTDEFLAKLSKEHGLEALDAVQDRLRSLVMETEARLLEMERDHWIRRGLDGHVTEIVAPPVSG